MRTSYRPTALKFAPVKLILNVQYVTQTKWNVAGSPVKCGVNQLEIFEIVPSQTTLHLRADCANSHATEMTCRPARKTGRVPPCTLLRGLSPAQSCCAQVFAHQPAVSGHSPAATPPQPGRNGRTLLSFSFKIADFCWSLGLCTRVFQLPYFVSRSLFRQAIQK